MVFFYSFMTNCICLRYLRRLQLTTLHSLIAPQIPAPLLVKCMSVCWWSLSQSMLFSVLYYPTKWLDFARKSAIGEVYPVWQLLDGLINGYVSTDARVIFFRCWSGFIVIHCCWGIHPTGCSEWSHIWYLVSLSSRNGTVPEYILYIL